MGLAVDFAFHEQTKQTRARRFFTGREAEREPLPPLSKEYAAEEIALSSVFPPKGLRVEEAIRLRRSQREYLAKPLSLEELSRLLYHANGITGTTEAYGLRDYPLKAAPSAGGLTPIELYPVVNSVEALEPGLYYYHARRHSLQLLKRGDFRKRIAELCLEQDFLAEAAVVVLLSAVYERSRWKYGERAYRYVHLDAGHVSQNLLLEAVALGLGACCVGAFFDDEVNGFLGLEGSREFTVLGVAVGAVSEGGK